MFPYELAAGDATSGMICGATSTNWSSGSVVESTLTLLLVENVESPDIEMRKGDDGCWISMGTNSNLASVDTVDSVSAYCTDDRAAGVQGLSLVGTKSSGVVDSSVSRNLGGGVCTDLSGNENDSG